MAPAAVLLDALGTLVRLEDPTPRLRASLRSRLGLEVSSDRCRAAMQAEMRHYVASCSRAADLASLAALRLECADVLADVLGVGPTGADLLPCLTDAIAFSAYADAVPALELLSHAGCRLAVVSNWDVSLEPTLARVGLRERVECVVHSAEAGASKPDPAPFRLALRRLGLTAADVVHVGDDPVNDVKGARALGIRAFLLDRAAPPGRAGTLSSLLELPAALGLPVASA